MILKGRIVTLRPIEEEDLAFVREMFNDPEMEQMVVGWSWPVSAHQHRKWYEKVCQDPDSVRLIIETKKNGAVGLLGAEITDWKNRIARTLGVKIAKKQYRTRGTGFDAMMSLFKYLFEELQMNRVDSMIIDYNVASKTLVEKLGYKLEGVRRKYIYKKGAYHDLLLYGLLRKEYEETVKRLKYWDGKVS